MKKAYVGSANNVKVNAVKKILEPFGYEVIGIAVNSLVSNQPLNDEETIKGAYNRAKALPNDGLRIGLEAGVELVNDDLFLTNFGVLIDQDHNIYKAGGTRIVLPEEIKKMIFEEHLELSDAMEKHFKTVDIKHHQGAIGYFTTGLVVRMDIFEHIVKLLYGQCRYKTNNN